jgi:hypothetical protein
LFFESLGERLATLAKDAGMTVKSKSEADRIIRDAVKSAENSAQGDSIRQFVKRVSSKLIN